jgi:hypothetical protein
VSRVRRPRNARERISRAGFNRHPSMRALLQYAGLLPNLLDPNLKAIALHVAGAWQVIPGPASALYGQSCPVSNSAANGFESSPFWPDPSGPLIAAKDITDATAPFVAAADAQNLLGSTFWSGDHTVYTFGFATAASSANPITFSHGNFQSDGVYFQMSVPGGAVYNGAGTSQSPSAPALAGAVGTRDKWCALSVSRNGTNYVIRANGTDNTTAISVTALNPTTRNMYFGRANAAGSAMRGPLACVLFYNTAHTSAQKAAIEALLFGTYAITPTGVTPITVTRAGAVRDMGASEPENLITRSEELDAAVWTKQAGVSITPNADPGPDSSGTADLVVGLGNQSQSLFQIGATIAPNTAWTPGFWIKRVSTSGVLRATHPNGTTLGDWQINLASLSNGWEYITATHPAVTVANAFVSTTAGATGLQFFCASVVSFYLTKVQGRTGASAPSAAYVRTYADARPAGPFVFPVGDNARIAHPVKGLPCFAGTTNLLLQSETFDNASWVKTRATISANATAAPDRSVTADKLVEDTTATSTHVAQQNVTKAASALLYTYSIFLKAAERSKALLQVTNNAGTGGASATFDLITGAASGLGTSGAFTGISATSVYAGNGWWRCSVTVTSDTDTTIRGEVYPNNGSTVTYTGDGASGIYVWGAQLEQSTFAGPYVPTTTASASSVADKNSAVTPASLQQLAGDFEFEVAFTPAMQPNSTWLLDTRTPGGLLYFSAANLAFNVNDGTTADQVAISLSWNIGQTYKIKGVWQARNLYLYRDGVLVAGPRTNVAINLTGHSSVTTIGCNSSGTQNANGHVRLLYVGKPRP